MAENDINTKNNGNFPPPYSDDEISRTLEVNGIPTQEDIPAVEEGVPNHDEENISEHEYELDGKDVPKHDHVKEYDRETFNSENVTENLANDLLSGDYYSDIPEVENSESIDNTINMNEQVFTQIKNDENKSIMQKDVGLDNFPRVENNTEEPLKRPTVDTIEEKVSFDGYTFVESKEESPLIQQKVRTSGFSPSDEIFEPEPESEKSKDLNISYNDYNMLDRFASSSSNIYLHKKKDPNNPSQSVTIEKLSSFDLNKEIDKMEGFNENKRKVFKDMVLSNSENVNGKTLFNRETLYDIIGDRNPNQNIEQEIKNEDNNEPKKNVEQDNEPDNREDLTKDEQEVENKQDNRQRSDKEQRMDHAAYMLANIWNQLDSNRNMINKEPEEVVQPKSLDQMSKVELVNTLESMDNDFDFMSTQLDRYESSVNHIDNLKKQLNENDNLTTESRARMEKDVLVGTDRCNRHKEVLEDKIRDYGSKLDHADELIATNKNTRKGFQPETNKAFSAQLDKTSGNVKKMSDKIDNLTSKNLLDKDVTKPSTGAMKNFSNNMKNISQKVSKTIANIFSRG